MSPVTVIGVNVTCPVCHGTGKNPDVNNPNMPPDTAAAGDDTGRCMNCQGVGYLRMPKRVA